MRIQFLLATALLVGCASGGPKSSGGRTFVDSSTHANNPPEWVKALQMSWEDNGNVMVKSSQTIRGAERVNGCFDLAKLNSKEAVITEIATDIRGQVDNAQTSLSEDSESILGKVRSENFQARIVGLKFKEQYYERYRIEDVERIDCHVLAAIKKSDYDRIKREIVDKVAEVDPQIREAIKNRQVNFFAPREPAKQ